MKILKLYAENIKRLKAVEITPDGVMQIVSGRNAQGKTSVLDSIWLALQYRKASLDNPSPVRHGEDHGVVQLDLGEYVVTRTFNQKEDGEVTTSLKLETANGDIVKKPQQILDGIIGDLSFDPLEFARKNESDQRTILSDLVFKTTGINLNEFDAKIKEAFSKRTEVNREKKRLEGILTGLKPPDINDPVEKEDFNSVYAQMSIVRDALSLKEKKQKELEFLTETLKKLENQIQEVKNKLFITSNEINNISYTREELNILDTKVSNIAKNNEKVDNYKKYHGILNAIQAQEKEAEKLSAIIELNEIEKDEALEASKLPIQGLKITESGVLFNGVPFKQLSGAQKLKVSLSLAMASNPSLRVIRITDGSLLDSSNLAIIREMAEEKDFQVWIEMVDDTKKIGVYIEDGTIV